VITRTMLQPWKSLAWTVFILSFVIPFVILISKKVKTKPVLMIILCTVVIIGMWLEHLLLLGPALNHHADTIPFSFADILISLGFLGLLATSVTLFVHTFPETMTSGTIGQETV
jgi:hypothetical protein